jgi:uncharacterized protein
MSKLLLKLSNAFTRMRAKQVRPENLLLLFPNCLQNSDCDCKIVKDPHNCKRCGKCKVKDLVELADKYGIQVAAASGGRLALQRLKAEDVKAVVAVACELELRQGMLKSFPKAVLGVANLRPHGPCVDTDVELDKIEEAVRFFLGIKDKKPA